MILSLATGISAEVEPAPAVRHLRDAAAGFHGPAVSRPDTGDIWLGVIAPSERIAGRELLAAVRLVVDRANTDGGISGRSIQIVDRTDDQPWHSAAHEVTRLVREEGVVALLGGLDGARAHAAELIVAKLWVPLISPTAADRSVDVANVPWVFRCAPDEQRQMGALVRIAEDQGWQQLRLLTDDDREGRLAQTALQRIADRHGLQVQVAIAGRFDAEGPTADGIVLWTRRETALQWLSQRDQTTRACPLLMPLHLVAADVLDAVDTTPAWAVVPPQRQMEGAFADAWRKEYGTTPSAVALLTAEATQLLLASMRQVGTGAAQLREALSNTLTLEDSQRRFDVLGGDRSDLGVAQVSPDSMTTAR